MNVHSVTTMANHATGLAVRLESLSSESKQVENSPGGLRQVKCSREQVGNNRGQVQSSQEQPRMKLQTLFFFSLTTEC